MCVNDKELYHILHAISARRYEIGWKIRRAFVTSLGRDVSESYFDEITNALQGRGYVDVIAADGEILTKALLRCTMPDYRWYMLTKMGRHLRDGIRYEDLSGTIRKPVPAII